MSRIRTTKYAPGSLAQLNEIRSYPKIELQGNPITRRTIKAIPQDLYILQNEDATIGMGSFNLVCAYYVSRFYKEEGHHNIERSRLAICIAGIIANCADWGSLTPWTRVISAYKTGGIDINIKLKTTEEFKRIAEEDVRFKEFLENWTSDIGYVLGKTNLMFILASTLILAMMKNLNENNFEQWFKRRILTFSGTLGDMYTPNNITEDQYPMMSQVVTLYSFMSSNHQIRKIFYQEIVAIARSPTNFISKSFSEIHHLVRGHEMNHLVLIDKHMMQEHPELLKTVTLRGLTQRFGEAIKFLRNFDPSEQMYVKILQDKDECALTNRKIFSEAATIATAIAEFKNSNFENYYHDRNPSAIRLRDRVIDYLTLRYSLMNISAGGHDKSNMDEKEAEVYMQKALDKLDDYNKDVMDSNEAFESLTLPQSNIQTGV